MLPWLIGIPKSCCATFTIGNIFRPAVPFPRDHLSCGEIGTEYGLQRPKQSLFHRNFMGMCDNARRKTSAVFGGLSMLYEFCAENFERVPAAIDAGAKRIELCDNLAVGGTTPSDRKSVV